MTDHNQYQELLALSAAGLLDPAEERRLREHLRNCPQCTAREAQFAELALGLSKLSAPSPAPALIARTEARMAAELAAQADRRQGEILAGIAGLVAWGMTAAGWYGCRAIGGGAFAGLELLCFSTGIATVAAAVLMRSRRLRERSL